ncbi:MAG TPA: SDR family oxidoreductase [Methylomirabilota bacterium]|nr:SDR family oxidoreductase [Methylomirabilota bacterium]
MGFSGDTLRDRVAIVTGASQGIGRAIAVELAKVGAHVVACSRRGQALEPVADAVRSHGQRALAVACDVGDASQVDSMVARTLDTFGRIDLLVNNAGYRIRSPFEELPRLEWDAMMRTNLTGVYLLSQAVGRVMIRQRAGKIVNVSSVAARTGSRGLAAYAATKAALTALTQSLGAEWAKYGITVNALNTMEGTA